MESGGSITVRVKSASLSCEDIVVDCNLSNKVLHLKELIRLKSPMHPETGDQRLIYAGHLMDDDQHLKDVLLGNGETSQQISHASFTVHLATTLRGLGKSNQQENSKKVTSSSSSSSGQHSSTTSNVSSANSQSSTSSPRVESPPNVELPQFHSMRNGVPPDVLALHAYYVEQMMQYMMQWSQMTLGFVPPPTAFTATTNNIPTSSYIPAPPPPVRRPEEPGIVPQNIEVQDNVRVAEVRAGEEDEAPRDVLDWMYTIVRVALIFSVVYFYSNFTRFFLVVLFTALVMVFQRRQGARQAEGGIAAEQRQDERANVPPPPPQEQAQNTTQEPSEGNSNNTADDQGSSSGTQSKHDPSSVLNEEESTGRSDTTSENSNLLGTPAGTEPVTTAETSEPRRSIRDITLTFLTTFFTSLIPEIPQNN